MVEAALRTEREANEELRATQQAFNRLRQLGTPMELEEALRMNVDEYLSKREGKMRQPVPERTQQLYRASIESVFSERNLERDATRLENHLRESVPELTDAERVAVGIQFGIQMKGWSTYLKTELAIRRLHAASVDFSMIASRANPSIKAHPSENTFLVNPTDQNVRILAAISNEYVHAKALFLDRVLESHGVEAKKANR